MKHFANIPSVVYEPSNLTDITASMKNLFYTLEITIGNSNFIDLYTIEGIKRLDNISFELYDTTEHWWILAKINNIDDIIYDLPIDEEVLQKVAEDRTLALTDDNDNIVYADMEASGALDYYLAQFEILVEENDNKRQINIIKPEYMGAVITEIVKSL